MSESKGAVVAALLGNLLIAVLKLVAGLLARSAAMLAEAAHSFSDVGNQVLLLVGMQRANRPPTTEHPFGTGKDAYFWPFMVAILLFGVAGAYSALEGIDKIRHPHAIGDLTLAFIVLGVSFAIEAVSISVAIRQAIKFAREHGVQSVGQFREENRDAALLTVLVEDSLALIGLPVAALALGLSAWTGQPVWDGIGSLAIGLLLMAFVLFLGSEVKGLLVGRGLSLRDTTAVTAILSREPAVRRIVNLQSMYLSPSTAMLGCEIEVDASRGTPSVLAILQALERDIRLQVPALKFVYLEPQQSIDPH